MPLKAASRPMGSSKGATPEPKRSRSWSRVLSKSARSRSSLLMNTSLGIPSSVASRQVSSDWTSTPSTALTTRMARSATDRPASTSAMKSAYPGVSMTLILQSSKRNGASANETEICLLTSSGSKSQTVVPSSVRPGRDSTPPATSSASARVVLPAPPWPMSATLRIFPDGTVFTWIPHFPRPGSPRVTGRQVRWTGWEPIGRVHCTRRQTGRQDALVFFRRENECHANSRDRHFRLQQCQTGAR